MYTIFYLDACSVEQEKLDDSDMSDNESVVSDTVGRSYFKGRNFKDFADF